jgi:hypothetical protein
MCSRWSDSSGGDGGNFASSSFQDCGTSNCPAGDPGGAEDSVIGPVNGDERLGEVAQSRFAGGSHLLFGHHDPYRPHLPTCWTSQPRLLEPDRLTDGVGVGTLRWDGTRNLYHRVRLDHANPHYETYFDRAVALAESVRLCAWWSIVLINSLV